MQMNLHIPLSKIDEEKRLVYGRAVQEIPDKSGEIIDYATAVPAFRAWSDSISAASGGLSKGNVREMHDAKRAVGKITQMDFNDAEKAIDVCVKVVDDSAWKKVLEGVYTGFSVGGSYATKWPDPKTGMRKYTPKVTELSLVDNPCIPSARIVELQKSDGSTAMLELRGRVQEFGEVLAEVVAGDDELTFGAVLAKSSNWRDRPREHTGGFARKTGDHVGQVLGGVAGGVAGYAATSHVAGRALGAVARAVPRAAPTIVMNRPRLTTGVTLAGAGAGAAGGAALGGKGGYGVDEALRQSRANKAGRREVYDRMKAKINNPAPKGNA